MIGQRFVFSLVVLVSLIAASMASGAEPDSPAPVLIVAFGPFAGRDVNGSATVAKALDGEMINGHRIVTLVLPVQWGMPEAKVPDAVRAKRPSLVLGLGEGFPGQARCERIAHNRAAHPDENGRRPPRAQLDPTGPATRTATLAFSAAWFADAGLPVTASDDAGDYLCNNLLYVSLAQADVPRCGFLHLPPQGTTSDADYLALAAPVVRTLVARNLDPSVDP